MVTREERLTMCRMRIQGYTLQDIADVFHVSKECVRQHVPSTANYGYNERARRACIYPNLTKWLCDKNYSFTDFAILIDYDVKTVTRWLKGENHPKKDAIDAMLKETGMTYEVLFKEDKKRAN